MQNEIIQINYYNYLFKMQYSQAIRNHVVDFQNIRNKKKEIYILTLFKPTFAIRWAIAKQQVICHRQISHFFTVVLRRIDRYLPGEVACQHRVDVRPTHRAIHQTKISLQQEMQHTRCIK